jgi:hypothetical protein
MLMPNLTSQVWNPRTTYMCGKLGAYRDTFNKNLLTFDPQWPWPCPNLTSPKWAPQGQFQGQPTHPYQVLWNWAQGRGRETNVTFGPNDLDLCRNKPLKGISGHSRTNPVKCVPEAPHNPTPIYPVNCVAWSNAPHKLTQCVARGAISDRPT